MIIPMLIRVELTTRSMTRKGRKIRKPIWKAVFSSLVMKAGIRTQVGTSARVFGCSRLARPTNSESSSSSVCLNMNSRSGSSARSSATLSLIWCEVSGSSASVFISFSVGAITNSVRKKAIPISTWLGGARRRAEAGADEAEDDQDPGEAGGDEDQRRDQGQPAEQDQQLDRVAAFEVHPRTVQARSVVEQPTRRPGRATAAKPRPAATGRFPRYPGDRPVGRRLRRLVRRGCRARAPRPRRSCGPG